MHRSDGSGTTFNFVNYLSKVSPEWKTKVGEGTSVKWPAGVGGKGNEGVAAYVKQIKGGIGYVELSYALQNKMAFTRLKNAAGNFVIPSDDSFAAAAASADWAQVQGLLPGHDQCTGRSILADHRHQLHPDVQDSRRTWPAPRTPRTSSAGPTPMATQQATSLDYVPLPPALVQQIEAYWAQNMKF